jgi:hypothetical protein
MAKMGLQAITELVEKAARLAVKMPALRQPTPYINSLAGKMPALRQPTPDSRLSTPMTPTLLGRWQTRIFLFAIFGSIVSLPFFFVMGNNPVFFIFLAYLAGIGLIWDVLYNYLQQYRWDHDWPAAMQLLAGIWEGFFFGVLFTFFLLPGIPTTVPLWLYLVHYSLVWCAIFIVSQSLMRLIFPRWRFNGGQWL